MKEASLLFLIDEQAQRVLLAMKKRGFGMNKWNGVGGKLEAGETIEQAAIRECQEEIGVTPQHLEKVAHLTFILPHQDNLALIGHTFISRSWQGEPVETDEMAPRWFDFTAIPYENMWDGDQHWLPQVLAGHRLVAEFHFDASDRVTHQRVDCITGKHELL